MRRIPVGGSVFHSSDPTILIEVHSETVGALIGQYCYELHELPRPSAIAYLIPFYVAQVRNGGHGQYLGNGRRYKGLLDLVDEGLERLGAQDFGELHRRFRSFLDADHPRADEIAENCGFGLVLDEVRRIDDAFLKLDSDALIAALAEYLRSEADLEIVPDGAAADALAAIGERNPHADRRAAVRAAAEAGALMQRRRAHPYHALGELLCDSAGRQITRLLGEWDSRTDDSTFVVQTTTGMLWMRVHGNLAALGLDVSDISHGRSRLPGLLALARWDGYDWQLEQLPRAYHNMVALTPVLRRLSARLGRFLRGR